MNDDILAKIRKILAKAEDPAASPAEAETYTAKAAELVAAYGIDRALLAETDPASDVVGDRVVVLDAPYALDKATLLGTVAHELRCRAVQRTRYVAGAKQISLHLFGFDSDLQRAELLYTSLLLQATTALARTRPRYGESVAAFRRSWLAGFTTAVGQRLHEAETRAEHDAERRDGERAGQAGTDRAGGDAAHRSVALVLADRSEQVESAVEREYPRLRKAQRRTLSGSGGLAGWQAGQTADLGGSRLGGAARGRIAG
ncbi:MAG TPA: DUF2786 domain-containing protein [Nocardioidaceae bacterium]|jgi:hypothetical protein